MVERETKEFTAIHKFARISADKARFVANLVRGLPVNRALTVLKLSKKRGAYLIGKVLKSAIANAQQDEAGVNVDNLYVKKIWVDHAGLLNKRVRWRPGPMGRAMPIRRRLAHIGIVVSEYVETGSEEGKE